MSALWKEHLSNLLQWDSMRPSGDAHLGQKAVVMGSGCIGLVSMMALKARGVSEVYVVDIMEKRLQKAMELGATGVINGAQDKVEEKLMNLQKEKGLIW